MTNEKDSFNRETKKISVAEEGRRLGDEVLEKKSQIFLEQTNPIVSPIEIDQHGSDKILNQKDKENPRKTEENKDKRKNKD